ncbi:MAG: Rap1a/Tai family immunity protein [Gammaproteobacteria bacterium]|nr:Rap1a/Tai family immunity protein [Gammaproteobacteria bacterium]
MRGIVFVLLLLPFAALRGQEAAPDSVAPSQQTGRYLLKACTASALTPAGRVRRQYCAGFLTGVEETLRVVAPAEAGFCAPESVTIRQLVTAFTRHATARPEVTDQPAAVIATQALRESFPCPGTHRE